MVGITGSQQYTCNPYMFIAVAECTIVRERNLHIPPVIEPTVQRDGRTATFRLGGTIKYGEFFDINDCSNDDRIPGSVNADK